MTSSTYHHIKDFQPHTLPLPTRLSSVGISALIYEDRFHPNNYQVKYFTRNTVTGKESEPHWIKNKLDPNRATKTTVFLMENVDVGIGYELVLQFSPLEGSQKADCIAVTVEYQVYL